MSKETADLYNQEYDKVLAVNTDLNDIKTSYDAAKKELDNIKATHALNARRIKKTNSTTSSKFK